MWKGRFESVKYGLRLTCLVIEMHSHFTGPAFSYYYTLFTCYNLHCQSSTTDFVICLNGRFKLVIVLLSQVTSREFAGGVAAKK